MPRLTVELFGRRYLTKAGLMVVALGGALAIGLLFCLFSATHP